MGRNGWIKAAAGLTGATLSVAHGPVASAACSGICGSNAANLAAQSGGTAQLVWVSAALGACSIAAVSALVLRRPTPAQDIAIESLESRALAANASAVERLGAGPDQHVLADLTRRPGRAEHRTETPADRLHPILVTAGRSEADGSSTPPRAADLAIAARSAAISDAASAHDGRSDTALGGPRPVDATATTNASASTDALSDPSHSTAADMRRGSWLYGNITPEIAAKIEAFHKEQEARHSQPVQGRGSDIRDVVAPVDPSALDVSPASGAVVHVRRELHASLTVTPEDRLAHWSKASAKQAHTAQIIQFPRSRRQAVVPQTRLREASFSFTPRPVEWRDLSEPAPTVVADDWFEPVSLHLAAV